MAETPLTFVQVEAAVRTKTFGVLTTIDAKGRPHSTGVLYGVAPASSPFGLFVLTLESYLKTRNVRSNPNVSLVVTFPHRILSFVPASCVTFRGRAAVVPVDDPDGTWAFDQQGILRDNMASLKRVSDPAVFLKLTPDPKVLCYGLGIGPREMRTHREQLSYRVFVDRTA
jgi:hypothetical protein